MKSVKGGQALVDFTYTLDAVGNPTEVVRAGSAAGTETYEYDAQDRLTEVCYQASCPNAQDPFIRYTYDDVGNRLTEVRPSGTTSYSYNAADELTQAGSTSYSYDENGNETAAGSRSFSYDLANRLASTSASGVTTSYAYDGDGVRRQESIGGTVTKLLWDVNHGLPQLALERDSQGTLLRRYLYGQRRLALSTPSATSYYHVDKLGSVANVTSASGASQWTYAYEPFGTSRTSQQDDGSAPANAMRYTGELLDSTGLYHLRARQYDPSTGRFAGQDPAGAAGAGTPQESTYVYAANQPLAFVDPSGETRYPADAVVPAAESGSSAACGAGVNRTRVWWYLRHWGETAPIRSTGGSRAFGLGAVSEIARTSSPRPSITAAGERTTPGTSSGDTARKRDATPTSAAAPSIAGQAQHGSTSERSSASPHVQAALSSEE